MDQEVVEVTLDTETRALIEDGIEAIRLTREYVDPTGELLPAIEGWSWFDWTEKARARLAASTAAPAAEPRDCEEAANRFRQETLGLSA